MTGAINDTLQVAETQSSPGTGLRTYSVQLASRLATACEPASCDCRRAAALNSASASSCLRRPARNSPRRARCAAGLPRRALTGTRSSAIQGDGKSGPQPASSRLSGEDRFCGAPVARITMIR